MSGDQTQQGNTGVAPNEARWGDPISGERAAELEALQRAWDADPGDRPSPFAGQTLTGADVFWLAARALAGANRDMVVAEKRLRAAQGNPLLQVSLDLSGLYLQHAILSAAHLEAAVLRRAHLEDATLGVAHLEKAFLGEAHLEEAFLDGAYLEGAFLSAAHLEGASLSSAHLKDAVLYGAHLDDAILRNADLRHADLRAAHLRHADMAEVYLQGANLSEAGMQGASLYEANLEQSVLRAVHLQHGNIRRATFDSTSRLNEAHLDGLALDQARLDDTNLAVVDWREVHQLGDEVLARQPRKREALYSATGQWIGKQGARKTARLRVNEYRAAARAYRSLSVVLRAQGLAKDATRFHFRAEVMSRKALFYEARARLHSPLAVVAPVLFLPWLLSLALGICAGYGVYHVWRLFLTYLAVVAGFAGLYWLVGLQAHTGITVPNALVLSVTSFHGRGLQPSSLVLTDTMTRFASGEAILGLLIEALFIAAFTRRVTGS